jgi:hypothetical protein
MPPARAGTAVQETELPERQTLTRFARILLTVGSGQSPWLIVVFILGVLALSVVGNTFSTLTLAPETLTPVGLLRILLVVAALVAAAYGAYRHDLKIAWRPRPVSAAFKEKAAPFSSGLLWLLSFGSSDLPLYAIGYHHVRESPERLRHCWVLLSPDIQRTELYNILAQRVGELYPDVELHPIKLESDTAEAAYGAVERVYSELIRDPAIHLESDQVISDMTGSTKQMTAGMVLACAAHGWPLEYVISQRDDQGKVIAGTQQAIRVDADFTFKVADGGARR